MSVEKKALLIDGVVLAVALAGLLFMLFASVPIYCPRPIFPCGWL